MLHITWLFLINLTMKIVNPFRHLSVSHLNYNFQGPYNAREALVSFLLEDIAHVIIYPWPDSNWSWMQWPRNRLGLKSDKKWFDGKHLSSFSQIFLPFLQKNICLFFVCFAVAGPRRPTSRAESPPPPPLQQSELKLLSNERRFFVWLVTSTSRNFDNLDRNFDNYLKGKIR